MDNHFFLVREDTGFYSVFSFDAFNDDGYLNNGKHFTEMDIVSVFSSNQDIITKEMKRLTRKQYEKELLRQDFYWYTKSNGMMYKVSMDGRYYYDEI